MQEWFTTHGQAVQSIVSVVTAIVWIFYLQLFLMNYLRQRRPEIIVSRGAGIGLEARCFIANLGLEPLYISQLLMTVETEEGKVHAAITDREKMSDEQVRDPKQATNQGPLRSGDSFDAGSFGELVDRALDAGGMPRSVKVRGFELTVVAVHAGSASYVGARRRYDVFEREDKVEIAPDSLTTTQMRSFLARRKLKRDLQRDLSWLRS